MTRTQPDTRPSAEALEAKAKEHSHFGFVCNPEIILALLADWREMKEALEYIKACRGEDALLAAIDSLEALRVRD